MMKSRNRAAIAAAAFAGLSIVPTLHAQIPLPGFTQSGAGATDWTLNGSPQALAAGAPNITGNQLQITTPNNDEATSAFYNTKQTVNNFVANFDYQFTAGSSGGGNPADGFAFVLQNAANNALGGGGGGLGYVGIGNSVALAFDVWNANTAGTVTNSAYSASGYGGINNYSPTTPVSLRDLTTPVHFNVAYRDGVFTETLTQGTNTFSRKSFYDVTSRVGATGWVGFTGGTGGANSGQRLSNFSYTVGNAPAVTAPGPLLTGVPQGGVGFFGVREVMGAPGCCGDLNQAQTAVLAPQTGTSQVDYTAPILNLYDSDVRGSFQNDSHYRLDPDQVAEGSDTVNNIAVIATGTVRIPTTGMYTFGSNSDDGFRLTIGGRGFEAAFGQGGTVVNANGALEFPAGRGGGTPSLGTIFLPAGDYPIQMLNWEGGGGASVELYASPGIKTAFDTTTFNLVGNGPIAGSTGRNKVLGVAQWQLKEYTTVANVTEVITAGRGGGGPPVQRGATTAVSTIHFNDPQDANNGSHGGDAAAFPNDNAAIDDDNYGAYATTTLTLAAADVGRYTFMLYTDDDSRFRITLGGTPLPLVGTTVGDQFDSDGVNGNDQFGTNGCCSDQFGHYDLNTAGVYTIEAAFHEGGGGSGFFVYATQGDRNSFDPAAFQLLGANVNGATWNTNVPAGLQLVPEPGSISLLGLAGVGLMARRRRQQA